MCEPRNFLRPCIIQGYPSVDRCLGFQVDVQYQVRCPRVVQLLADMAVVLDGESLVSKVPLEMPVSY